MIDPSEHIGLATTEAVRQARISPWAEWDDLYQVAMEAIILAAGKFDESLGFRFSSYAVTVIRNNLREHMRRTYITAGITYAPADDWTTKCNLVDFSYEHDDSRWDFDIDSWRAVRESATYPKEYPVTRDQLARALATLDEKEVCSLDFSMNGQELADKYGVTKQAINLWKHRALTKLREYFDVPPEDYEDMPRYCSTG